MTKVEWNISQLIKGILIVTQKLLKWFYCAVSSTPFLLPLSGVFPVIFILDLNDPESVTAIFY